jgi:reactive intermediate/imine deaminase
MVVCSDDIKQQAEQVFKNLAAIVKAAGADLNDSVKINISMTDLSMFDTVNQVMTTFLEQPFPARACVEVAALPKGVKIEVEAIVWVKPSR